MIRRASLFLLFLVLVNIAGFYGYFLVRLHLIHEESRVALRFLPDSELERFVVSEQEFQSIRVNEREVEIDGKMYDVARKKFANGYVEFFARHDEAEDNLLAFIEKVITNSEKDGKTPLVFSQFSTLHFLRSGFGWEPTLFGASITHETRFVLSNPDFCSTQTTPPPRSV